MLVLSRKQSQKIVIDGRIEVTIVKCSGGRVRLGISAPADVSVKRGELEQRATEQQAEETGKGAGAAPSQSPLPGGPAPAWETVAVPVYGG